MALPMTHFPSLSLLDPYPRNDVENSPTRKICYTNERCDLSLIPADSTGNPFVAK